MQPKIIITDDGSHTLRLDEMDENYHSTHGAAQESTHVFIKAGLSQINKSKITIFEVGFGTALNALLTWRYAKEHNLNIQFYTIEKFPIQETIWKQLNHGKHFGEKEELMYTQLHQAEWGKLVECNQHFSICKLNTDLNQLNWKTIATADLTYFDAFAPNKQSEMWSVEVFQNIFNKMNPEGIFVTYCAKGQVRRDLQSAGFSVERIPGPPGKREMLRAKK